MTKTLHALGATGNDPTKLSASRVTMYVAVAFYMIAAAYVLLTAVILPATGAQGVAIFDSAETAAKLVFDKMWVLMAPYFGKLFQDGAVRVAEKRSQPAAAGHGSRRGLRGDRADDAGALG